MSKTQKNIFLESEGDHWFQRNKEKMLTGQIRRDILEPIITNLKPGMSLLEVGCSVGTSLNYIHSKVPNLNTFGIDPSKAAIEEGKKQYPHISLQLGTVDDLDQLSQKFDFLLFGFCLYLTDRESLKDLVKKTRQALKPGAFVGIIDFDPKVPIQNPYTHCDGIFSYKMDYAKLFLDTPYFSLVSKKSWNHSGDFFTEDMNERCSTQVLYFEKSE